MRRATRRTAWVSGILLMTAAAAAAGLLIPAGASVTLRAAAAILWPAVRVSIGRAHGNLLTGARFEEIKLIAPVSSGAVASAIPQLSIAGLLTSRSRGFLEGSLQLPDAKRVRFTVRLHAGLLTLTAHADRLALRHLFVFTPHQSPPAGWSGWLEDVDLLVDGPFTSLALASTFHLAEVRGTVEGRELSVRGCRGTATLQVTQSAPGRGASGTMICEEGQLTADRAGALLRSAAFTWPGGTQPIRYRVALEDLQLDGVAGLPPGTAASIQRVVAQGAVPASPAPPTLEVFNGRFWLPRSDPAFFSGAYDAGVWDARFYIKTLDLRDLLALVASRRPIAWTGTLTDVGGAVKGPLDKLEVTGQFHLDRLASRLLTVAGAPGTLRLELALGRGAPAVTGEVLVNHGMVQLRHVALALQPSRLVFLGDPTLPNLEANGTTVVEGTKIRVTTQGALAKPEVKLFSDPPMSQERLLVMVATGKAWNITGTTTEESWLSTDVVTDALDFFVLGGSGSRLARRFGISEASFQYDPGRNRIGATATIADRVALEVETDASVQRGRSVDSASPAAGGVPSKAYKIGAAYKLTDTTSVGVEGERELLEPGDHAGGTGQGAPAQQSEDTIFLKLKKRF